MLLYRRGILGFEVFVEDGVLEEGHRYGIQIIVIRFVTDYTSTNIGYSKFVLCIAKLFSGFFGFHFINHKTMSFS